MLTDPEEQRARVLLEGRLGEGTAVKSRQAPSSIISNATFATYFEACRENVVALRQ